MFILNQEKDTIVNSESIKTVHIVLPADGEHPYEIIAGFSDFENIKLGSYKERKDADSVLKFIAGGSGKALAIPSEADVKKAKEREGMPGGDGEVPPFLAELLKHIREEAL